MHTENINKQSIGYLLTGSWELMSNFLNSCPKIFWCDCGAVW